MTSAEYDYLADAFYRATGVMAPGKDVAPGMSQPDHGARSCRWGNWLLSAAGREARERFAAPPPAYDVTDDELDQAAAVYADSRASRGHARSYDRAALRAAIDAVLAARKGGAR